MLNAQRSMPRLPAHLEAWQAAVVLLGLADDLGEHAVQQDAVPLKPNLSLVCLVRLPAAPALPLVPGISAAAGGEGEGQKVSCQMQAASLCCLYLSSLKKASTCACHAHLLQTMRSNSSR